MTDWRIEVGDCRDVLRRMPARSVHTVVTSPPYFGLRSYVADGSPEKAYEIGLEPTPDEFVAALVDVFRGVRRVLRDDGTVWLNLGDSFCSTDKWGGGKSGNSGKHTTNGEDVPSWAVRRKREHYADAKPKDLLGIPWAVAFALRADGWYLRSDIVWSKPNPMPESVTDRPTKAHEYVFLLSKAPRYYFDADAIREDLADANAQRTTEHYDTADRYGAGNGGNGGLDSLAARMRSGEHAGRNKRSVWTVATQPYANAHFATYPPKLIEPCILGGAPERACGECGAPWVRVVDAPKYEPPTVEVGVRAVDASRGDKTRKLDGKSAEWREAANRRTLGFEPSCSHGDGSARGVVLDPFAGAGTTGLVALQHGREFVGIELNPEYARMARERIETAVRLGFRSPQGGGEQIPGQVSIFDLDGAA